MDSITATPDSQQRSVLLTAVNAVGEVTWTRNTSGGPLVLGTGTSLRDYPPFGSSIIYEATDDATTEVADPLSLPDPDKAVLTNTLTGVSRDVIVVSQPPLQREGRSKAHFVLGRPDPVVTIAPPQYATGTLRLYCAALADRAALVDLLSDGGVLRLRRPSTSAAVDDATLLVEEYEESLVSDSAPAGARYLDIDVQAVAEITYNPVDPSWTYDALVVEQATYTSALAAYATYTALAAGPPS
jgi:hypothetical protein